VNADDAPRLNSSEIHIDFMIGSDEVTVSGITRAGRELTLLRGRSWQL
jgi:aminopeptidase